MFEYRRISNFQSLVTSTLSLDRVIRHTVVHQLSTSTHTFPQISFESRKPFVDGHQALLPLQTGCSIAESATKTPVQLQFSRSIHSSWFHLDSWSPVTLILTLLTGPAKTLHTYVDYMVLQAVPSPLTLTDILQGFEAEFSKGQTPFLPPKQQCQNTEGRSAIHKQKQHTKIRWLILFWTTMTTSFGQ